MKSSDLPGALSQAVAMDGGLTRMLPCEYVPSSEALKESPVNLEAFTEITPR